MEVQIPKGNGNFWALSAPQKALVGFAAVYATMAEPIKMPFGD